jgi:hypothetical protein
LEGRFTVRFITAFGQRWERAVGASLTIALLAAVAVVGISLFGSEVFAAWKTPENSVQVLSTDGALAGILNFEAPAETVARFKPDTKEAVKDQSSSKPLVARNWKYTQNSFLDSLQNIYTEGIELQLITIALEKFFPNSPLSAFAFTFTTAYLQTADGFLSALHLPPVPAISPFF